MNARACRVAAGVLAAVVVATLVATPRSAPAATLAQCPGRSPFATDPGVFTNARHPLVLVHGWTSKSDSMGQVETALEKRIPDTFEYRYFDYRANGSDWAAQPAISACLADYINEVSDHYRRAGGDGKVFVVTHSMGGLAIRFATDPATVAHPIPAAALGGIVTIETPHLGSVFGNTWQAQLVQWGKEHIGAQLAPDHSSDAAKCLAIHSRTRPMPQGCATPPFLPAGVPLAQVSATNIIRRTLFGLTLYDIPLGSDGIVSVDSATGYILSGPPGAKAPKSEYELPSPVSCTITSDETLALLRAAAKGKSLPGAIISAEVKALGLLWKDSSILDHIMDGTLNPDLEVLLGVALFFYPCGHSAVLHNPDTLDATAQALRSFVADTRVSRPAACIARALARDLARIDREAGRTQDVGQTMVARYFCTKGWAEVVLCPANARPGDIERGLCGNAGGILRDVEGRWEWAMGGDPEEPPAIPVPQEILNELYAGIDITRARDTATF